MILRGQGNSTHLLEKYLREMDVRHSSIIKFRYCVILLFLDLKHSIISYPQNNNIIIMNKQSGVQIFYLVITLWLRCGDKNIMFTPIS